MRSLTWMLWLSVVPLLGDQEYVFLAPVQPRSVHVGGGGEAFVWRGLGVGGEVGYVRPVDGGGAGLLSVNGSYHWNARSHWKVKPFVTAGYSLAVGSGVANLTNVGGGITYWMKDRLGLRVEYREYVWRWHGVAREVRFGVALR